MNKVAVIALVGALAGASLAGCTRAEHGAAVGATAGAAVGAVATRSVGGAAVGAGAGALAGYFLGKNSYRCEKTNIFGRKYIGWCIRP
jgi:hypothetical protein